MSRSVLSGNCTCNVYIYVYTQGNSLECYSELQGNQVFNVYVLPVSYVETKGDWGPV